MSGSTMDGDATGGALAGVLVLDLARVLAGPWATQILADLGADVIKVERPGAGDDTRAWGPPFAQRHDGEAGDAAYFLCTNRNKRSATIDIGRPEGAALVAALAAKADVVVENFKVGALERYGLDYPSLSASNPRLVYCSITGFGQTGPAAQRPGYDYMIQAMGGLMSITGEPDGPPMKAGVAVTDLFTGLYAANAVMAGLLHARTTGRGQHIDVALFDVQVAMLANQAANYFATGRAPERLGNAHPNLAPYEVFSTSDTALVLAVGNDAQFRAACRVLGAPEFADDPRFASNARRVEHRAVLSAALAPLFAAAPSHVWLAAFERASVPCGPINDLDQVFSEPQAQARGIVVEQSRPDLADPIRSVASPLRLSLTPPVYQRPPPSLGEHTREVLMEQLGLAAAELDGLAARGVI